MKSSRVYAAGFLGLYFAVLAIYLAAYAYHTARYFNGAFGDGPMQVYNPLRRFAAGQAYGIDFCDFHGFGQIVIHYPLFLLFGSNLFASELARNLLPAPLYFAATFLLLRALGLSRFDSLLWPSLVVPLSLIAIFPLDVIRHASAGPIFSFVPTGTLSSTRASLFLFVVASFLWLVRDLRPNTFAISLGAGITSAILMWFGPDKGMEALLTGGVLVAVHLWMRGWKAAWFGFCWGVSFALGTAFLFIVTLGWRAAVKAAAFFHGQSEDQFWCMGSYRNHASMPWGSAWVHWFSTPGLQAQQPLGGISLILLIVAWASVFISGSLLRLRKRGMSLNRWVFLGAGVWALVSLIPLLGLFYELYLFPPLRTLFLLSVVFPFTEDGLPVRRYLLSRLRTAVPILANEGRLLAAGALTVFVVLYSLVNFPEELSGGYRNPQAEVSGCFLSPELNDYYLAWEKTGLLNSGLANGDLWSTNAGLIQGELGIFNPGDDYLVHELGRDARHRLIQRLNDTCPPVVELARSDNSFGLWHLESYWPVILATIRQCHLVAATPFTTIWVKDVPPRGRLSEEHGAAIDSNRATLNLPWNSISGDLAVLDVRITYRTWNSWSPLPLAQIARYRISFGGSMNPETALIPPNYRDFTLPILARRGQTPVLSWDTASLFGGGHIQVENVAWRQLTGLTDAEIESLFEGYLHPR